MKLWGIFRFELTYQVRRPWPWLMFAVVLVVCFLMTRDAALADALYEEFLVNASFQIVVSTVVGLVLWLLVAPVIAGEAAARDVATGMYPLIYTAPISKTEYLGGRFLAALVLNAVLLLAVQVGILLAVYSPGVNAELIGPFRPAAYLTAYAYIALPTAIVATAVQFALALRSGRPMAGYLGSLILGFMGFFVASLLLFRRGLGTLLDPIGIRYVIEDIAHLWTTAEKNTRMLAFEGVVLQNRLVWLGVALGVVVATYWRFRFVHRSETSWWARWLRRRDARAPQPTVIAIPATAQVSAPRVARTFGSALHVRQSLAIAWDSLCVLTKSWPGLFMLVFVPLFSVLVVLDQMLASGSALVPTTGQVLKELTGPLTSELSRWVIVPGLTIFFAGELIWREREASLGEITDTVPAPDWVPFLGKFLGLALLLAAFMAVLMAAGMVSQLIRGYHNFDIGLYLTILFGMQLPEYLLFALLALVVHVVVNQKYIGHLAAVMAYVLIVLAPLFGIEHNLLIYGAGPWWTYTDMRGLAPFVWPWLWFKLYWAAWGLLLAVVARLLWVRGKETGFAVRLRLARHRITGSAIKAAALAVGLIITLGAFIFYNTNVLGGYRSSSDIAERGAEYEKRYSRYANIPQPRLTGAKLQIEIYPERREISIRGTYHLENRGAVAIDSVHLAVFPGVETDSVTFNRPARPVLQDEELGYRIYALAEPLRPNDSLQLDFTARIKPKGFRQSGADLSVVANGTFFTNNRLPAIGYQRSRELLSPSDRRGHGLTMRPVIPSLYDVEARKEREPGIVLEAVMGTAEDQIAVAPGALLRTWKEGGRSYFHYATAGPIGGEWGFASAHYAVREAQWKNVAIRFLHHPEHTAHLDRMMRSIQASLDYYTAQFGPYRYGHVTVVEVPGDGVGIHAEASMLTHGEGVTLLKPNDTGRGSLDFPFAIMAHEMGHQWGIPIAIVEGAPVMSESLAWYYAIKVVQHTKGEEQLRRLMSFMREPNPIAPIRRGEPLLRGLDPYMSYRRGPFALYALSEYIGEDRVNTALRRLYESHRPADAPPATTLDLYRELQAVTPDSMRYLLHDLFEVNTYWQLRTERVAAEQTGDSTWQVTLDVRARKVVFDSAGVETEVPMNELIEIGIFAPNENAAELAKPLYMQTQRIRSGAQTITVTVRGRPELAGIDPHHLLDWEEREDDDNVDAVTLKAEAPSGPRSR